MLAEVASVSAVILGSLGGGGVAIFGLSNWLGKVWANRLMQDEMAEHARKLESLRNELRRDTESHKIRLRKSELIFEKEFEAASALVALIQSYMPTFQQPGMDSSEAFIEIAPNLDKIEKDLGAFLAKYGAVLPDSVKNGISGSIGIAGEGKFEVEEPDIPPNAVQVVEQLFERLWEVQNEMLDHVRSQTSV